MTAAVSSVDTAIGAFEAPDQPMIDVELRRLVKRYGSVTALAALDLVVPRGELLSLLGPSGCGKTTLLRLVAGLLEPSAGEVRIGGRLVTDVPPHRRNVGFVFQNYALFPHQTVRQNVGYGLRVRGVGRKVATRAVNETLDIVRLGPLADRYPSQLSGGQQQRVALARALVLKPTVLLLDEPFAALDKGLREQMQLEIRTLQRRLGITTVFVTHDQEEALTISDRIAVINGGRIEQIDRPEALYEAPKTEFVLKFIGRSNIFPATVARLESGVAKLQGSGFSIVAEGAPAGFSVGARVNAAVRPGKMSLSISPPPKGWNGIEGRVAETLYLGTVTHYYLDTASGVRVVVHQQNTDLTSLARVPGVGESAWIQWLPKSTLLFAA
jgi:spermidine/putrescine ABC transporter ATP-binding subunit